MLRRVKTEVEAEMAAKTEVLVKCPLSLRQQALYKAVRNKISIADLLSGGGLSDKKALSLMNIVIQLRKVGLNVPAGPPRRSFPQIPPDSNPAPVLPLPAPRNRCATTRSCLSGAKRAARSTWRTAWRTEPSPPVRRRLLA